MSALQSVQQYSTSRRFPRYVVDRSVSALLQWEGSPYLTLAGRCRVMSEGGMGIVLPQQLNIGQVVFLELANALRVYGAVRNLHGFTHGFEFVLLRDAQRSSIRRLCGSWSTL